MTTLQQYLGRFYIGVNRNAFSIGASVLTIPAGWYYLCGYSGESAPQLCETMQAQIRSIGAGQSEAVVAFNTNIGRVGIFLETAAALTFDDSELGALLGYSESAYGSAYTFVSEAQPRYVWRPTEGLVDYPGDLATWWSKSSTTLGIRAPAGTTYTVKGNLLYDGAFSYELLPLADVISTSATEHVSFEQFWVDVIHEGQPIRCYHDRTLATAASIATGICLGGGEEDGMGSFTKWARRHVSTWDGLWSIDFAMAKWVSA